MPPAIRIVLLGSTGQVGWELQRALAPLGEVVALDRDLPPGQGADFADPLLAKSEFKVRAEHGAVIAGRAKEIIFVNGQNYYPHDLEAIAAIELVMTKRFTPAALAAFSARKAPSRAGTSPAPAYPAI